MLFVLFNGLAEGIVPWEVIIVSTTDQMAMASKIAG